MGTDRGAASTNALEALGHMIQQKKDQPFGRGRHQEHFLTKSIMSGWSNFCDTGSGTSA